MNDRPLPGFAEAMGRIQSVTECRTQQELADFLGIRQSSIADAKRRGSIPSDWLLTLWRKKEANPDWILWGQGSKSLQPVDLAEAGTQHTVYVREIRLPEECSIEQLVKEIVRRALAG